MQLFPQHLYVDLWIGKEKSILRIQNAKIERRTGYSKKIAGTTVPFHARHLSG